MTQSLNSIDSPRSALDPQPSLVSAGSDASDRPSLPCTHQARAPPRKIRTKSAEFMAWEEWIACPLCGGLSASVPDHLGLQGGGTSHRMQDGQSLRNAINSQVCRVISSSSKTAGHNQHSCDKVHKPLHKRRDGSLKGRQVVSTKLAITPEARAPGSCSSFGLTLAVAEMDAAIGQGLKASVTCVKAWRASSPV